MTEYNLNKELKDLQKWEKTNQTLSEVIGMFFQNQFDKTIEMRITDIYWESQGLLTTKMKQFFSKVSQGYYLNIFGEKCCQVKIKRIIANSPLVVPLNEENGWERTIQLRQILSVHKIPESDS